VEALGGGSNWKTLVLYLIGCLGNGCGNNDWININKKHNMKNKKEQKRRK